MEKHKAIIKGMIEEVRWSIQRNGAMYNYNYDDYPIKRSISNRCVGLLNIYENSYFLKFETIWLGDIDKPTLEVGEKLWINDLELLVKITNKYRTTNGEVVYETNHIINSFTTVHTETTRLNTIDRWFTITYPDLETFEELKIREENRIEKIKLEKESEIKEKEGYTYSNSYNLEEKEEERTWFGWLKFFKK